MKAPNMHFFRLIAIILTISLITILLSHCDKKKPIETSTPETGTINGQVIDAIDSSSVSGALISAEPSIYHAYTDSAGLYKLDELSPGQYLVTAFKEGYRRDSIDISLEAGQWVKADFVLTKPVDRTKWAFVTDRAIYYSTPAIDNEGSIYVATGIFLGSTSGSLYAIHPDGTLKWKYNLDHNGTSPVIDNDGTIYMMDRKNVLYALNQDGTLKWRYESWDYNDFAEVGQRPVAIGHDHTLYVYVGFSLYAIQPEGTRKWKLNPNLWGTPCGASLVVGKDSTIYGILGGEILYAVRPDGTLKWEFYLENFDEHSYTSPALDGNDVIYFGTENNDGGYVYAVYPNGVLKWRIVVGGVRPVRASPVIGPDGTVYIGTKAYSHRRPAEMLAISPEGTIRWRYTVESVHFTPDDVYATAAIGANGLIYFGAETGFVYALNPDGILNWKQDFHCGINWSSPVIINDGTLYIGTMINEGGFLLAIQSNSLGLADSPWPTFRQNNKNTGRNR